MAFVGDSGSLTVQDYGKQAMLRLTQIRFTGPETTVSNTETLQKQF